MKQKISKVKLFWTLDAEEAYFNEMADLGWKLSSITLGCIYHFKKSQPGEYICRIGSAFGNTIFDEDKDKRAMLLEYLQDMQAEVVPEHAVPDSKTRIYAVRRAELGEFDFYTDLASQEAEYRERQHYFKKAGITFFVLLLLLAFLYFNPVAIRESPGWLLVIGGVGMALELFGVIASFFACRKYKESIRKLKQ